VVLQDHALLRAESLSDLRTFAGFVDHAAEVLEQAVVLVERAGVLRQRIELAAERRPGLAVQRVRVRGRDDLGPRLVNRGMDRERGAVQRPLAIAISPCELTSSRSETRMREKCKPKGLTQK